MPEGSKKSRLTQLKDTQDDDSPSLQFPDLDGAGYMVALLQEAGLIMSNGMGAIPLTWQEIESWLRVTELALSVWEKLTLREMSEAYCAELTKATDRHAAPPFTPPARLSASERTAVSSKIANILRGFKRKSAGTL